MIEVKLVDWPKYIIKKKGTTYTLIPELKEWLECNSCGRWTWNRNDFKGLTPLILRTLKSTEGCFCIRVYFRDKEPAVRFKLTWA